MKNNNHNAISQAITCTLQQYFSDLDGEKPVAIYDLVLQNVEKPMLKFVLEKTSGNQTEAAELLGINRNTLRKKLNSHNLL